ncbi:hypothetical protein LTR08_006960 [Meristemomyces frigidus]|nr:hypothetical protein LTR08_006960 [Meristemomyces frigidus]
MKHPITVKANATANDSGKATQAKAAKSCLVCAAEVSSFRASPATCSLKHTLDERACHECWEAYLSLQVEEQRAEHIACMFCHSMMPEDEVKRLSRAQTSERYDAKLSDRKKQRCQARCDASRVLKPNGMPDRNDDGSFKTTLQDHDWEIDGRLFVCKFCSFQTCTFCDRPEHVNDSCEAYQSRLGLLDTPIEVREKVDKRVCKVCPSCSSYFIIEKGCGYTTCTACQYRFCQRCLIPWVGECSAYLMGKSAHGTDINGKVCTYRDLPTESGHSLQNRFAFTDEDLAKLVAKSEAKGSKGLKKEADEDTPGEAPKKGKRASKETVDDTGLAKKAKLSSVKEEVARAA